MPHRSRSEPDPQCDSRKERGAIKSLPPITAVLGILCWNPFLAASGRPAAGEHRSVNEKAGGPAAAPGNLASPSDPEAVARLVRRTLEENVGVAQVVNVHVEPSKETDDYLGVQVIVQVAGVDPYAGTVECAEATMRAIGFDPRRHHLSVIGIAGAEGGRENLPPPLSAVWSSQLTRWVAYAAACMAIVWWSLTIWECAGRSPAEFPSGRRDERILWLFVIVLGSVVGAPAYYVRVMRRMPRRSLARLMSPIGLVAILLVAVMLAAHGGGSIWAGVQPDEEYGPVVLTYGTAKGMSRPSYDGYRVRSRSRWIWETTPVTPASEGDGVEQEGNRN